MFNHLNLSSLIPYPLHRMRRQAIAEEEERARRREELEKIREVSLTRQSQHLNGNSRSVSLSERLINQWAIGLSRGAFIPQCSASPIRLIVF